MTKALANETETNRKGNKITSTRASWSYRARYRYRYPWSPRVLLIFTKPLSRFHGKCTTSVNRQRKNEAERTQAKNSKMPSGHPVSLYLLHVPLGGALALPVPTGLARGAEQQGSQFIYPLRGGDGAGRRRRRRRCGAQPVIPPQHRPQHPRVLPSDPLRLLSSPPFVSVTPSGRFRYPSSRATALSSATSPSRLLVCLLRTPLVPVFLSRGGDLLPEIHATARAIATPVAGELRSSADVASPRLAVDDDVDVDTRSPTRDAGAYHVPGRSGFPTFDSCSLRFRSIEDSGHVEALAESLRRYFTVRAPEEQRGPSVLQDHREFARLPIIDYCHNNCSQ